MAADAFRLSGIPDWDAWNERMVRGESNNEARRERVPVIFPEPKLAKLGSIYEIQRQMGESYYEGGVEKYDE